MNYTIKKNFVRFDHPEGVEHGVVVEELLDLVNNPTFTKRMNFLVDLRSVPKTPEAEDIKWIVSQLERLIDRIGPKIAFIVKSQVEFGMIRMFGTLLDGFGFDVNIFESEKGAISWLNEP